MAKTYPVKWMKSTFRGAPQIDGSSGGGGYLAALYAFLVTGFGAAQALSVTVNNGVGTAVFPSSTVFEYYSVVLIEGVTSPASLNGEARVLSQVGSTITFETDAPDGTATGVINFKYAPVGWERVFSEANKAVFRSLDPQSPKFCIRIDDTGAASARVRGFESMSSIDAGTGPFPTDAQINGGGYILKSTETDATTKIPYFLAADSRMYLYALAPGRSVSTTALSMPLRGFGDLIARNPAGDPFAVGISCSNGAGFSSAEFSPGTFALPQAGTSSIYVPRPIAALTGSTAVTSYAYCGSSSEVTGADSTLGAFPSSVDGELKYGRRYVPVSDQTPRADIPGVLHIPQTGVVAYFSFSDLVPGGGEYAGRMLAALPTTNASVGVVPGALSLVDITGPWR